MCENQFLYTTKLRASPDWGRRSERELESVFSLDLNYLGHPDWSSSSSFNLHHFVQQFYFKLYPFCIQSGMRTKSAQC